MLRNRIFRLIRYSFIGKVSYNTLATAQGVPPLIQKKVLILR